jgi:hypothetical protein
MTPRMVIRVTETVGEARDRQLWLSLEEPPVDGVARLRYTGSEPELLNLTAQPLSADSVRAAGRFLFDKLTAHPAVGLEFKHAVTPTGPPLQLYVELCAEDLAESVPWEMLCSPNDDFLSLDTRWPVSRRVRALDGTAGVRGFRPPLRVALLLSCLDITAAQEWQQIWTVLSAAPFPVEVLALVSEEELRREITAIDDPQITVKGLPTEIAELQQLVSMFKPHVVHVFCHGSLENGPHLELAVAPDWKPGTPLRSVLLEPHQINELSNPAEPTWLAVLNCCEVGAPAGAIHSLARDLVSKGPFSAAIAMREPIRPEDAVSFSGGLYPGLIAAVHRVVEAAGTATDIDWASMMVEPRRRLCQNHPKRLTFTEAARSTKQWTLPVLYVRPTAFQASLDTRPTRPAESLTLELLRVVRSQLPPGAPVNLRAAIDTKIAQLETGTP